MKTMDETSIIVSLCKITLSDLTFSWSAAGAWVKFVDIFDKISDGDDNTVRDDSVAISGAIAEAGEAEDGTSFETKCCCVTGA